MVTIIYSNKFLNHVGTPDHPERPGRLSSVIDALRRATFYPKLTWIDPTSPTQKRLLLLNMVHCPTYIEVLQSTANLDLNLAEQETILRQYVDFDTYICPDSYNVALLAMSAWLDGVEQVLTNHKPAFVLARPPGHHALKNRGMGFCLLNNVALAAHYALQQPGIQKVAILDWDVHHGNGTQSLVESNSQIAFCSLHEMPSYPRTGYPSETGYFNNVLNIPIPAGSKLPVYQQAFEFKVIPFLKEFAPDLLIISAGYDANAVDPLSRVCLLPKDYRILTRYCRLLNYPIVLGLEGGYACKELGESVAETIGELIGDFDNSDIG